MLEKSASFFGSRDPRQRMVAPGELDGFDAAPMGDVEMSLASGAAPGIGYLTGIMPVDQVRAAMACIIIIHIIVIHWSFFLLSIH